MDVVNRMPLEGGLAGALLRLWRERVVARLPARERELQLLETLTLGGRKQLHLVRCGGEHFLVSSGSDAVHSIVRVADGPAAEVLR